MNKIRKSYILISIFIAALFVKAIYRQIAGSFFEQDLLWFMPTLYQALKKLSLPELIRFILDPAPIMYGVPFLKIYALLILKLFGPLTQYFIITSVAFHFCSSLLLYHLCRRMGLDFRVSLFSAATYLTFFAQYGAYIWPMALQHLLVVFFTLLVLNLYFKTDELIDKNKRYKMYYAFTLAANLIASFCRISIVILPIAIITHILFCEKSANAKIKKYYMWLPLFATYLLYPLFTLTYVGDNRINIYLAKDAPHGKYAMLFIAGLAGLVLTGFILKRLKGLKISNRARYVVVTLLVLSGYGLLCLEDIKNILLPYNMLVPFMASIASFLNPLQNALLNDSARPYHFIYPQLGVSSFLTSLFFIAVFLRNMSSENRKLFIFVPWYIISVFYVNLRNPIASRYFIYTGPIISIVFWSVAVYCLSLVFDKMRLKAAFMEAILITALIGFSVSNALAIDLDILRSRFANTFLTYDYIKAANTIKEDIVKDGRRDKLKAWDIGVNGVRPVSFKGLDLFPADNNRYDNFRFVITQVFNNNALMANMQINDINSKNRYRYTIKGDKVINEKGEVAGRFNKIFESASASFKNGDFEKARSLFDGAVKEKPFLLRYILEGLTLEDLQWITGGADLRAWLNRIISYYMVEARQEEDIEHIAAIVNTELDSYIQCLFHASYLHFICGDIKGSRLLFSEIGFLESDYNALCNRLMCVKSIQANEEMALFLKKFDNSSLHIEVEYRNTYKFERLLFKLIFNRYVIKDKSISFQG